MRSVQMEKDMKISSSMPGTLDRGRGQATHKYAQLSALSEQRYILEHQPTQSPDGTGITHHQNKSTAAAQHHNSQLARAVAQVSQT